MTQPVFHRLHPGTILISMMQAIQRSILIILYAGYSCVQGAKTGGTQMGELFGAGIGLLIGAGAVFRYFNYGYAIHDGSLVIRDGWITRKTRTIPLNRIQNINFKRGLIHRVMNLVDVEIETAGGGAAEASLSALTEESAQRLKVLLTGESHLAMSPVMAARQDPLVYSASGKELFLAGATQNRALTIIAGIFGTAYFFVQGQVEKSIGTLLRSSTLFADSHWAVRGALALAALLVFGWLASIVMSFVTYWNFELRRSDDKLKRSYGLINHIENVIIIRRIQVVRLSETMIQRWMNLGSMHVDTAGGLAATSSNEGGQRQAAAPNSNLISPLVEGDRVAGLIDVVLPGLDVRSPAWEGVSPLTVLRRIRVGLLVNLIPAVLFAFGIQFAQMTDDQRDRAFSVISENRNDFALLAAGLYVAFCLVTWLRAMLYYRTARWWDQGDVFVSRTGVLSRNTWYAPIAKIQSIQISQTPGQRRLKLASLTFRTAAMHGTAAVEVQDLPAEAAGRLAESLHQRSAVHAWMNPDGF